MDYIEAYVDGSYLKGQARWAFIIVENDIMVYSDKGKLEGEVNDMHQIGGELKAVMQAIIYARKIKKPVKIYYDLVNIYAWVAGAFGEKSWKTRNPWTKSYAAFVIANKQWVHSFVKVKAHSGNKWNEEVDGLAGSA